MFRDKIIIGLCFIFALSTPVFAQTQLDCAKTVIINSSDGSVFNVELLEVDGTTWTYQICKVSGHALSHTNIIGLEACIDNIIGTDPESEKISRDHSINMVNIIGVKFEADDNEETCGDYSITFDDTYEMKSIEVVVKASTGWGEGSICGPDCDETTFAQEIIFGVKPGFKKVKLEWKAISETDVLGYNILRAEGLDGTYQQINDNLIQAKGSIESTVAYNFKDDSVKNGTEYSYKLIEVQNNNETREHGPVVTTPKLKYFIHDLIKK